MRFFYSFAYIICQSISRAVFRLSVKGRENIPEFGPFIAASNHIAYFDPVVIGSLLKREIAFLARVELFDQFLLKDLIRTLNAFPVKRGRSDITSLKTSIHILQKQKMPLLIFPEGTRVKTGKLGSPLRGIAFIAARTKVPILPVYIENSDKLGSCALCRRRLKVRLGKIIPYTEYKSFFEGEKRYYQFAQMVMSRIQQLKDQTQAL